MFQYVDDDGQRQAIDSGMVNEYLREVMGANGEGFTAKDFRTWGATVRAIAFLSCLDAEEPVSGRALKRCIASTAQHVAATLGNTPAVCRKSYINPLVFDAWRAGIVHQLVPRSALSPARLEKLALKLLERQERRRKRNGSNGK